MRIERLAVEGFGPFAQRQEVDFRALESAGLFLITGRTGSGKSSILDAVCFALYGGAPRYDGDRQRLRSDHAEPDQPTRVELEFAVGGERWRVTRSPEFDRPKRRGSGSTRSPQTATLERWDGGGWAGVAARPVDVAEHLAPVLGLTREQFLQVVLLAQGRFQEFLRAKSEDRATLLRALFGTERFAHLEEELARRAKVLEQAVGRAADRLASDLARIAEITGEAPPDGAGHEWAAEVAAHLDAEAGAAKNREALAAAGFTTADAAAADTARVAALQQRRYAARAESDRLDAAEPEVAVARDRLADAVRVLPVLPALTAAERAGSAAHLLHEQLDAARTAVPDLEGDEGREDEAASALDALLGSLRMPLADESALPVLATARQERTQQRSAAEDALTAARAATAEVPPRRGELVGARADAVARAAGERDAASAVERADGAVRSVREAARLAPLAAAADRALADALACERDAAERTRDLVARRIAGAAGELSRRLEDGAPCAVCGSLEHPHPAEDADPVAEGAVETAQATQDTAAATRAARADAAAEAQAALAAARGAAAGLDEATATARAAAARRVLDGARDGRREVERVDAALILLVAEEQKATELVVRTEAERNAAGAAESKAVHDLEAATARVAAALGGAPSVAARAQAITVRRDLLRALGTTRSAADRADRAAAEAAATARAALDASGLADSASARSLALGPGEREAIEHAVRRHDASRAAVAAVLIDPDIVGAPAEPVDLAAAHAAKATALTARDAAADSRAHAVSCAERSRALAAAARAADEEGSADREQLAVLAPLAAVVRGDGANDKRMRLESYVLAARLEQIVAAANTRLAVMTDGRFTLRHDDSIAYRNTRSGLGLEVLDDHTGRPRSPASLSGGETFLASLALALGLAEVVSAEAGGVRLDTLFVDEGFGSLDGETLDTAMRTLDSLRAGGRVVGLISHVEAMQEDVPAGLHVERTPEGPSRIRLRGA